MAYYRKLDQSRAEESYIIDEDSNSIMDPHINEGGVNQKKNSIFNN